MYAVSCIVPVYNLENQIQKCVDSLLAQTLGNIEIILVNDCSTDGSRAVLDGLAARHGNIVAKHLPRNMRQGAARNAGLKVARGEYVVFIDGDDWVEPDMLASLYACAAEHDYDIVDSDYYQEDENGNLNETQSMPENILRADQTGARILHPGRIVTKLFRRSLLIDHELFFIEGKKFEDNPYLALVFPYAQKVGKVSRPFYHYMYNPQSTSRKLNDYSVFDRLDTAVHLLEEAQRRGFYEEYRQELDFKFIELYYANTVVTCITKFHRVEYGYIRKAYEGIRHYLPDYRGNPYIATASRYVKIITRARLPMLYVIAAIAHWLQSTGVKSFMVRKAKAP